MPKTTAAYYGALYLAAGIAAAVAYPFLPEGKKEIETYKFNAATMEDAVKGAGDFCPPSKGNVQKLIFDSGVKNATVVCKVTPPKQT